MNKEEIERQLYGIFKKFFPEADLKALWDKGKILPLTGAMWNLDAINMTYLLFEVEQAFAIHIHPGLLENYRFNSVDGIISVIRGLLER